MPTEAEELISNEICVVVVNSCVEWSKWEILWNTCMNTNKTLPLYSNGVLYGLLFLSDSALSTSSIWFPTKFLVSLPSVASFKLYWLMRWRLIWTVGEQFVQHVCSFSEVCSRWEYDDICRSAVEFFYQNSSLFINYICFEIM